ncbi:MAG: helix-turn-helix transcriptional regulator [Chloroflexi bacterium]|nr:helix-turn-helix transcriptional regulator [Chloroflexota bacterium]
MAEYAPFADWLAASMQQHDLSRLDVAAALRVYYNVLLDWLSGAATPTPQEVSRLAEYFEVPSGQLVALVRLDEEPEPAIG